MLYAIMNMTDFTLAGRFDAPPKSGWKIVEFVIGEDNRSEIMKKALPQEPRTDIGVLWPASKLNATDKADFPHTHIYSGELIKRHGKTVKIDNFWD